MAPVDSGLHGRQDSTLIRQTALEYVEMGPALRRSRFLSLERSRRIGLETGMGDKPDLDAELDRLQERLPDWPARILQKVRSPAADRYRVPAAIALTVGGVFGFMPILGFWMTPLGLGLLAVDVPVMRPPLAKLLARINGKRDR